MSEQDLVKDVERDFEVRREERRLLERGWQLNLNFVNGNQYCDVDSRGELYESGKEYFWQERRVFNHIAPIVETRLSKLSRIRPALSVRSASEEENDKKSAKIASSILSAVQEDADLDGVISSVCMWAEVCGTGFYKALWSSSGGNAVGVTADGKKLYEGTVRIVSVSPFEIYPYSLDEEDIEAQLSIIQARAIAVEDIKTAYGVELAGKRLEEFTGNSGKPYGNSCGNMLDLKQDKRFYELVIERYEKPRDGLEKGRLTVVAGGELLFDGDLPYMNGEGGTRSYPFIKQASVPSAGKFFGSSVVDRLIPLQRAYNAVKNRKHEFLNRIAMGVLAVEDGAVDADELSEDGLTPGKVLVYRQGSRPPEMLTLGGVPAEFEKEEERLLEEFFKVSGTNNLTENADAFAGITSATGLQLVLDQDEQRLSLTYNNMKRAIKMIGRHILRLFRQFAVNVRLMKYAQSDSKTCVIAFKGSDISSDDVVLEADSDLNMTGAQKRTVIYEMLDKGLFYGEDGKLSPSVKNKLLNLLGYSSLTDGLDLTELNKNRAEEENTTLLHSPAHVKDYDGHEAHIAVHTAYLLSNEVGADAERRICAHIEQHKKKIKNINNEQSEVENG